MTPRRAQRGRDDESGFTLVELIVAMAILALVMAAMAPGFYNALASVSMASNRNTAAGLAVQAVETARSQTYASVAVGCPAATDSTVGSVTYAVAECVKPAPPELGCNDPYKEVTVTVTWPAAKPAGSVTEGSSVYPGGQAACSSSTSAPSPPVTPVCTVPSGSAGQTEVDLTWVAPASTTTPVANYAVYYSESSSFSTSTNAGTTTAVPTSASPFQVTGLSSGVQYYFEVWSVSSTGLYSTTAAGPCTTTAVATAPAPPTALAATVPSGAAGQDEVDLTWKAPTSSPTPVAQYAVAYSEDPTFASSVPAGTTATVPTGSSPFQVTGLSPGTVYYFEVWSVSSGGVRSTPAGPVSATTTAGTTTACSVSSLAVDPQPGQVNQKGYLRNGIAGGGFALTANTNGYCSNVTVQYTADGTTESTPLTGSGVQLTGTAGTACTKWNPGSDVFTVYVDGVAQSAVDNVSITEVNGSSGC